VHSAAPTLESLQGEVNDLWMAVIFVALMACLEAIVILRDGRYKK
jgi:hypothetical protein